jgi:hypothetical protein
MIHHSPGVRQSNRVVQPNRWHLLTGYSVSLKLNLALVSSLRTSQLNQTWSRTRCSLQPPSLLLELGTPDRLKYILLLWRLARQFTWAPPTMCCWAPDKKPPAGGSSANLLRAPMPETTVLRTRVPDDDAAVLSLMDNDSSETNFSSCCGIINTIVLHCCWY